MKNLHFMILALFACQITCPQDLRTMIDEGVQKKETASFDYHLKAFRNRHLLGPIDKATLEDALKNSSQSITCFGKCNSATIKEFIFLMNKVYGKNISLRCNPWDNNGPWEHTAPISHMYQISSVGHKEFAFNGEYFSFFTGLTSNYKNEKKHANRKKLNRMTCNNWNKDHRFNTHGTNIVRCMMDIDTETLNNFLKEKLAEKESIK